MDTFFLYLDLAKLDCVVLLLLLFAAEYNTMGDGLHDSRAAQARDDLSTVRTGLNCTKETASHWTAATAHLVY